jgi:hypothetical protein
MKRILSSPGGAEVRPSSAGHVLVAFGIGRQVPTSDDAPGTQTLRCWTRSSEPEAEGVSAQVTSRADRQTRSTIYSGSLAAPSPMKLSSKNAAIHGTRITPTTRESRHVSSGRGSGSFRRSCLPTVPDSTRSLSSFTPFDIVFLRMRYYSYFGHADLMAPPSSLGAHASAR